jgi:hypothetical protein
MGRCFTDGANFHNPSIKGGFVTIESNGEMSFCRLVDTVQPPANSNANDLGEEPITPVDINFWNEMPLLITQMKHKVKKIDTIDYYNENSSFLIIWMKKTAHTGGSNGGPLEQDKIGLYSTDTMQWIDSITFPEGEKVTN